MIELGDIQNDEQSAGGYDLFIGPIGYEVVAVNPTLKELHNIGMTWFKQDPIYVREFSDNKISEVVFYCKALNAEQNNQIVPLRFPIKHGNFINQAGTSTQFIDRTGRTKWAASPDDLTVTDFFTNEGVRPACRGEEDLYKFVNRWLNLNTKKGDAKDCLFDIKKIQAGDFSEIKNLFVNMIVPKQDKMGKSYSFAGLTGVYSRTNDEGKQYHNLEMYNKQFYASSWSEDFLAERFKEYVEGNEYNAFSKESRPIVYTYTVSKFNPNSVTPSADPTPKTNPLDVTEGASDGDLPF